jgi:hypothetical protein
MELDQPLQITVETLRLLKRGPDVEFKVTPEDDTKTVMMSCLGGTGYRNMARRSQESSIEYFEKGVARLLKRVKSSFGEV